VERFRAGAKLGHVVVISLALAVLVTGGGGCGSQTTTTTATKPPAAEPSARIAGKRACTGLTPLQAARRFQQPARRAGVKRHFATLVADPSPRIASSSGYPRLVASLYATTIAGPKRAAAAAGCAEELAASTRGG
jgi:hypothetical protein